jgi:hypothetical protein
MSLDDELATLLARLGVELEEGDEDEGQRQGHAGVEHMRSASAQRLSYGAQGRQVSQRAGDEEADGAASAIAEVSLFQTSREHYGVFYRVDLVHGLPNLRVYMPEEEGALKVSCYLVRAASGTPLHEWFISARAHEGSPAYEDAREAAQQHLLFAAGELMKRLFWTGDLEEMRFPEEIDVRRIA